LIVPTSIPHPPAAELLAQAADDPSVFLIHPGVEVSVAVGSVANANRLTIETGLRALAESAGYRVVQNAPIKITANISAPKQEAVSYIGRGSYVTTQYTSTVAIDYEGKSIWARSQTNIPGMLQTSSGQSIQEKLDELSRQPNTSVFTSLKLPKLLQKPSSNGQAANTNNALMKAKFTLNGLIDAK
jgi:hypothetical protein